MKLVISKQFQAFIEGVGFSLEYVLERAGIPNILWKEELELSPMEYCRFLSELDEIITDDQVLAMSEIGNISTFMPPFFVALCAKNAREGFERFAKYKKLICPLIVDMTDAGDVLEFRLSFDIPEVDMPRFSVLNEQLAILSLIRTGTRKQVIPVRIGSPYDYSENMVKCIGISPEKTKDNIIAFSREDSELPFITQNNAMTEYLEPELKRRLEEVSKEHSFLGLLEKTLFSAIPGGRFSREEVAQSLGISVRSMQRKLCEESTTYQQEVQKVQKMLALSYITDPEMSIEEIACLVGYSEQPAFSRAFKKWTGMTVTQYRKGKEHE